MQKYKAKKCAFFANYWKYFVREKLMMLMEFISMLSVIKLNYDL